MTYPQKIAFGWSNPCPLFDLVGFGVGAAVLVELSLRDAAALNDESVGPVRLVDASIVYGPTFALKDEQSMRLRRCKVATEMKVEGGIMFQSHLEEC